MKLKLLYLFAIVLMASCQSKYKYWNIDQFKMDDHALEPLDQIKLLYASNAPELENDRKYYLQVVVVKLFGGDTVNILTTTNNGFTQADGLKMFNFMPVDSPITQYTKVAHDPAFDHIANNRYPTIKGDIVQVSITPPKTQ